MSTSQRKDGIAKHDDGLDGALDQSRLTQIAIVLSMFFGKEGMAQFPWKLGISLAFLCVMALTTVLDMFTGSWITQNLSIRSRKASGLAGLLFAPFLHPSPTSAFVDCAPFFLLSLLVMVRARKSHLLRLNNSRKGAANSVAPLIEFYCLLLPLFSSVLRAFKRSLFLSSQMQFWAD
jgi:hypothetical protein